MSDQTDARPGADARIAQAERVATAINLIKWVFIGVIAVGTLVVVIAVLAGSWGSEERAIRVEVPQEYSRELETPVAEEPEGDSILTRVAISGLALVGGSVQALLVWIVFGWAQHTLGMLTILARRRAP